MLAVIFFIKIKKKIKMAGHQKQFPKAVCSVLPYGNLCSYLPLVIDINLLTLFNLKKD